MGFGAADPSGRIRSPIQLSAMVAAFGASLAGLALHTLSLPLLDNALIISLNRVEVVLGSAMVAEAVWLRTLGVDLLPTHALVKGFRRRVIPWHEVRAVVRVPRAGGWVIRLDLHTGKPVTLRAPLLSVGFRGRRQRAAFERDYHRIGQCWLRHHGPSPVT